MLIPREGTVFVEQKEKKVEKNQKNKLISEKQGQRIENGKEKEKLEKLLKETKIDLLDISNFFPFDLFPDHLIISLNRISLVNKIFWVSGEIRTIPIAEIRDVIVDTSLFFATLNIITSGGELVKMKYIKKKEAAHAKRLLKGLMTAYREDIDLTKITDRDLNKKIEELGKTREKVEEEIL